jgi:hypothetical protein
MDKFGAKGNVNWKYKAIPWRWTMEDYDSIIGIIKMCEYAQVIDPHFSTSLVTKCTL